MPCRRLTVEEYNDPNRTGPGYPTETDCMDSTTCNPCLNWQQTPIGAIVESSSVNGCYWNEGQGSPPFCGSCFCTSTMTERTVSIPLDRPLNSGYPLRPNSSATPEGSYEITIGISAAAYNNRGPGCTRFKFTTSVTGSTVYEIDGCSMPSSFQSMVGTSVSGCKKSAQDSVEIHIFDYFRWWPGFPEDQWLPPYQECLGCTDAAGWAIDISIGQCNCQ